MNPSHPSSFLHQPHHDAHHPVPTVAQEVGSGYAAPVAGGPLNKVVLVTVYRDGGRVRLNKEAAALFNIGSHAELRPGGADRPWILDCRPDAAQPVSGAEKATWQFRSGYRLDRVFPHNSPRTKIELALARWPRLSDGLYALWPVSG